MATLHLLADPTSSSSCQAAIAPDDAVLLIGDGVFACRRFDASHVRLGLIAEDAESRGIDPPDDVALLDYGQFVEWVVHYPRSLTWR